MYEGMGKLTGSGHHLGVKRVRVVLDPVGVRAV